MGRNAIDHKVVDGVELKRCYRCKDWKPLGRFPKKTVAPDGLQYDCKLCRRRLNARSRTKPGYSMYQARYQRMRKYGLDESSYLSLFEAQAHRCKICKATVTPYTRSAHVDHNHVPGFEAMPPAEKRQHIRGILCAHCNAGLGHFRDDVCRLGAAAEYLRDYEHLP